jgi:hypothetical protein
MLKLKANFVSFVMITFFNFKYSDFDVGFIFDSIKNLASNAIVNGSTSHPLTILPLRHHPLFPGFLVFTMRTDSIHTAIMQFTILSTSINL